MGPLVGTEILVPSYADALAVEPGQSGADRGEVIHVPLERRHHAVTPEDFLDEAAGQEVRPDLDPDRLVVNRPQLLGRVQGPDEIDRLPGGAAEVGAVDRLAVKDALGQEGGDDGDVGGLEADVLRQPFQAREHRVDLGGMEGEGHVHHGALETGGLQRGRDFPEGLLLAAEDGVLLRVDAGDLVGRVVREQLLNRRERRAHGQHAVAPRLAGFHQELGAGADEEQGVHFAQRAGRHQGRVLAQAVAEHRRGEAAQRAPELDEGHLQGHDGQLRHDGRSLARQRALDAGQDGGEPQGPHQTVETIHGRREGRVVGVQLLAEAVVKGALAGEDKSDGRRLGRDGHQRRLGLFQLGEEEAACLVEAVDRRDDAERVVHPARTERGGQVPEADVGVFVQVLQHGLDVPLHRGAAAGRQGEGVVEARVGAHALPLGRLFHQDGGVAAVGAEAVDDGVARALGRLLPRREREVEVHVALRQVLGDQRVHHLHADVGGDQPLLVHQEQLDQGGDAGRRLAVADVALDGADQQLLVLAAFLRRQGREHVRHGPRLLAVADLRARPVQLDVADVQGADAGRRRDVLVVEHLRRRVRLRDGRGVGRVVRGRREDDAQDVVIVGLGVLEPLDHDASDAIGPAVAVGRDVPDFALPSSPR